jgi:hypothetical protein
MKKNIKLNFNRIIFTLSALMFVFLMSCAVFPGRSTRDRAIQDQERINRQAASELRAREKAHQKMQPKNTKKMMKKSKKYTEKNNKRNKR